MKAKCYLLLLLLILSPAKADLDVNTPGDFKNLQAVKDVLAGKRKTANVAWWGFDKTDSTNALQSAINSGASKVIIPYMGSDWIVRPIKLVSNQEIVFDPGVVVIAKKGFFKGKEDCLFLGVNLHNVILRGYGATLRMQKKDYINTHYQKAQWRHVVSLRGCTKIKLSGLVLGDSGGDGIYIGVKAGINMPCKDIEIKDCIFDNNYRQGVSIISAENVRISNCLFKNTSGHAPGAGIDIEPNNTKNTMINIVVSECVFENNAGPGFVVALRNLSSESKDVSILFVNCHIKSGKKAGIAVGSVKNKGLKGLIEFRNCTIQNTGSYGAYIANRPIDSVLLRFNKCKWKNTATNKLSTAVPICFVLEKNYPQVFGGIEFIDTYVYDQKDRPFLAISGRENGSTLLEIAGNITVYNPYGVKTYLGKTGEIPNLKITAFKVQQ